MKSKLYSLLCSFRYAFSGAWRCICRERNFRIHLTAAAWALFLAGWVELQGFEKAVLLLTIAGVLSMELLNTAVEAVVDLCSPQRTPLAKVAKDTAAAAVLIWAIAAVIVGFWLLWRPQRLLELMILILTKPLYFLAFAAGTAISVLFVFAVDGKQKGIEPDPQGPKGAL